MILSENICKKKNFNFSFPISNSKSLVLGIGDFVPVRPWSDSSISCLAEIRKIWKDKTEPSLLTELRLYFLPENTPIGRNCHGEVSDRNFIIIDINQTPRIHKSHSLYNNVRNM